MKEGMAQPGQQLLTATEKEWRVGQRAKNLIFCSGTMCLLFFQNLQKRSLACRECDTLQTVAHYCSRSGFPYYNLTTLHQKGSPYLTVGDTLCSFVDLSAGNLNLIKIRSLHLLPIFCQLFITRQLVNIHQKIGSQCGDKF